MSKIIRTRKLVCFIPFLTGSKTPTSRFERNKEDKWEITVRKDPTKDRSYKLGET
jgi:hypothetical protein